MEKDWYQKLVEHERIVKERGLVLYELAQKARDKEQAYQVWDLLAQGKITYEEAVEKLKALACDSPKPEAPETPPAKQH